MRRSIVRLIAAREIRDLLRDRRTVLLIAVLPVVLYPCFGLAGFVMATSMADQKTAVGVVNRGDLPTGAAENDGKPPFPALLAGDGFAAGLIDAKAPAIDTDATDAGMALTIATIDGDPDDALKAKTIDAALIVPGGFAAQLASGVVPMLKVLHRDGDEKSKLAARRLTSALRNWEVLVRETKLQRAGLPKDFDKVFAVEDPLNAKPPGKKAADELRDTFVKVFPFILMMWLVAGAIQPAVDLTAGEKERGTMETLLISPAERGEIVAGKFLAVTAFTFGSVLWNVLWLSGAALVMEQLLGYPIINPLGLIGCVILGAPMAMFFSAISLALGVFARSTKEGQYYLMPLILCTMPLAFWSMVPGMELTLGNALVPVTGAMLLQHKLLSVGGDPIPWPMFAPVLGGLAVSVVFALWLAVVQFRRESVLFRESGPDKRSPLKRLLGKV